MSKSSIPNLERLRQSIGINQSQLAVELGVNRRAVIRWENGEADPRLADLRRIAAFFAVTVAHLIGDEVGVADIIDDSGPSADLNGRWC